MDIKTLIHHNLDELLYLADKKGVLNTDMVVKIGAFVGAAVLRGRYADKKEVTEVEINGVFGIVGDFCKQSFGRSYTKVHFKKMTTMALELIQEPTFDTDVEVFIQDLQA
ncbi:hypothetical protein HX004_08020 [Myroides sp. 1354]|uniref:hypothetical protein n=1 Tax=unclassified Myroides TaxID=2642485 RepID=UPI002576355D|nr:MULTISPECIES: hypothetical protein [unclassified Myroides]MDM1045824.1 hypothetical protein [Myroides sp. R163-1]MDM1055721.1 hypothetical protein [Myroides sp. 1354]MDM1069813.1 hypothetical protein [Myroides sp. 1372]